jgi:hypothetical protein
MDWLAKTPAIPAWNGVMYSSVSLTKYKSQLALITNVPSYLPGCHTHLTKTAGALSDQDHTLTSDNGKEREHQIGWFSVSTRPLH